LSNLVQSTKGALLLCAIVALISLAANYFAEPFYQRIVFIFMVNLIAVIGLQVFMGNTGITNYGHIGFMGIGAYAVAVLATPVAIKKTALASAPFGLAQTQFGLVASIVIALVLTIVIAFLVGTMLVRQSGTPASIATLALLVIIHVVIMNWVDLTRGPRAIYGIPIKATLLSATICAFIAILAARLFRDSPWGLQARAASEDIAAAAAMGVRIKRLRLAAWVLSTAILGMAGILFALFVGTISPKSFYFDLTFLTLSMLVLGGEFSVSGAVIGSIVVSLGFEITRYLENGPEIISIKLPEMFGLTGIFLGVTIVLCMILRPQGLVGGDEIDETWRRWLKDRGRSDANGQEE